MNKYQDVVQDRAGNAVSDAVVLVYDTETTNFATISATEGGVTIDQSVAPVTTDANGMFEFWVAPGTYDLSVTLSGYDTVAQNYVVVGGAGGAGVGPTWVQTESGYSTNAEITFNSPTYTSTIYDSGASTFPDFTVDGYLAERQRDMGAAFSIIPANGSLFHKTLSTDDTTFTIADIPVLDSNRVFSITVEVTSTGQAFTWEATGGTIQWPGGVAPTPTSGVDVYTFYRRSDTTVWRGALVASYAS